MVQQMLAIWSLVPLPFLNPAWASGWQKNFRKTSTSSSLTTLKPLTVWITTNCGKFLKKGPLASLTQWTWGWASSGRRWRTEKPGVLQSMGLQRVDTIKRLNTKQQASVNIYHNKDPLSKRRLGVTWFWRNLLFKEIFSYHRWKTGSK